MICCLYGLKVIKDCNMYFVLSFLDRIIDNLDLNLDNV